MKTFRLILALAAVALTAVSCVEKSGKYQTLLAQRDSLLTVEQKYDQTPTLWSAAGRPVWKSSMRSKPDFSRSAKSKTA